jgi:hypothetical protein
LVFSATGKISAQQLNHFLCTLHRCARQFDALIGGSGGRDSAPHRRGPVANDSIGGSARRDLKDGVMGWATDTAGSDVGASTATRTIRRGKHIQLRGSTSEAGSMGKICLPAGQAAVSGRCGTARASLDERGPRTDRPCIHVGNLSFFTPHSPPLWRGVCICGSRPVAVSYPRNVCKSQEQRRQCNGRKT